MLVFCQRRTLASRKREAFCFFMASGRSLICILLAIAGYAQTRVDLASQGKSFDFSNALSTKPFKAGAVRPATCSVSEVFLQTSGGSSSVYVCTGPNQWQPLSSGGGGTWGSIAGTLSSQSDLA